MPLRREGRHVGSSDGSHRRILRGCMAAIGGAMCLLLFAAAASAEGEVTRTFTAFEETFVVPQGVTSIHVVAIGGAGGAGGGGTSGGRGAIVKAELEVTPGETLYVHVGGNGILATQSWERGTGGHASDIRSKPFNEGLFPDPRLIVAGAGGGAGGKGHLGGPNSGGRRRERRRRRRRSGRSVWWRTRHADCRRRRRLRRMLERRRRPPGSGRRRRPCPTFSGLFAGDGGDGYYGGGGGGAHGKLDVIKEGEAGGGGGSSLVPAGGTLGLSAALPKVQISYTQPANPPAVVTGEASELREFSATVNATVNPEHEEVTGCTFEYGTSEAYGSTAPCSSAPGSGIAGAGARPPSQAWNARRPTTTESWPRTPAARATGTIGPLRRSRRNRPRWRA